MRVRVVIAVLVAALVPVVTAPAAPGLDDPSAADWPMFGRNALHLPVASGTALAASTAAGLGLRWQSNTGDAAYSSPAVTWNKQLGRRLVYLGSKSGVMGAYDADTGERVWWYHIAGTINSSPARDGNSLYFGGSDGYFYILNAATGELRCRAFVGGVISSSPVVARPDASGPVAFFGDNGVSGNDDGGRMWAINGFGNTQAPCSVRWKFLAWGDPPGSQPNAGSWSPPAFAKDIDGRPLVIAGSSSPDNSVYAWDAGTGVLAWRFQTRTYFLDNDVGAGPTIAVPGRFGFADGMAYVTGKSQITYALNLRTGAEIWEFNIRDDAPEATGTTRSTAALVDNRLLLGYGAGVYALDARTGARLWKYIDDSHVEVTSSPAITGPAGDRVAVVGDLAGIVHAISVQDGTPRWQYDTGGFIYGSAAISNDRAFIGSSNGFLYAFDLSGSTTGKPLVSITSPGEGSSVPNTGSVDVTGTASDDSAVSQVLVAIKRSDGATWWDASTGTWSRVFTLNPAALGGSGSSVSWSFNFPSPSAGGDFFIQAEAVDDGNQHSAPVATRKTFVEPAGNPPATSITSPTKDQTFVFPNDTRQSFPITVYGTATDTTGAHPGVASVKVVVRNTEHSEYWCGAPNCATGGGQWQSAYVEVDATLASPGGTSTNWSLTFPSYDHPHNYRVTAAARDLDGEADVTKASVTFCVRDRGFNCYSSTGG